MPMSVKQEAFRMEYTVGQVANMAGTSVRTLHHYEDMGLLAPARRPNGYRAYDSDDVARLQQILLYRACGMELADIKTLLDDPAYDVELAFQRHLEVLEAQKNELEKLIETVRKTLRALEEGTEMADKERFEGLKRAAVDANEQQYGAEARSRYGDAAVDAANDNLLAMDEEEWSEMGALETAIIDQLKEAMATGDPASEAGHTLVAMHAKWITMHWGAGSFSREAHIALANGYLADDRFRAYYDKRAGAGATEFLVAAIEAAK